MESIKEVEYNKALMIIYQFYHEKDVPVNKMFLDIIKQSKTVQCKRTRSYGQELSFLTLHKKYDIIHNPRKIGKEKNKYNFFNFAILDDLGNRRDYRWGDHSGIWDFKI